ncbi:ABC transporter permease [Kozakia baliensis]|uniref:ABC transporter permease n=1 Tax=Kozakia baliensis TaxID=153496 RepID=UPI0009DE844C|nr:ABC transporter permease [Kozakia baliensis]
MNNLAKLFQIQSRVIYALIMRELHTRFGRENLGFLWFVGEPILFCAGVAIVWTAIRPSHEYGLPMTAIVITGYVPLTMWRHCLARSVSAYRSNGSLMFHRQVTPLDIILNRMILEIIGTIIAGIIVAIGAILLGYMNPPKTYGILYLGIFFQSIFCIASGLIIASLSEMSDLVEKALSIVSYLSLPLSGAFTMVDWISPRYQWILLSSPSVESVEMIRDGQFGHIAHAHYNIVFTAWIDFFLLLIGLWATLRVRNHITIE